MFMHFNRDIKGCICLFGKVLQKAKYGYHAVQLRYYYRRELKAYTHIHLHTNVHSSIIHSNQKMETHIGASIDKEINKVWHTIQ